MPLSAVTKIFLLTFTAVNVSGVQKITITPSADTTVILSSTVQEPVCNVCTGEGSSKQCKPSVTIQSNATVEFTCPRPQDVIIVRIMQNIECTTKSCTRDILPAIAVSRALVDFNRMFIWTLKPSAPAFKIDFTKAGLRQIDPSEICPDNHTYTLYAAGEMVIGRFCRKGPICAAQMLETGMLSLKVPAKQELHPCQFNVSFGEKIKYSAQIKVMLQEGAAVLLSPNYPGSFPDDDLIQWQFGVPAEHNTVIQFLNHTAPSCKKKVYEMRYSKGGEMLFLRLTDPVPVQIPGNTSLTLLNCQMVKEGANPGLSLRFSASAVRSSAPVLCTVDLSKEEGLYLDIEKVRPGSNCELKMNSVTQERITVSSQRVTKMSFLDCAPTDLHITARKSIECLRFSDCPKAPVPLAVPVLPSCLPGLLRNVTWTLRAPPGGTVELLSSTEKSRLSLPGQLCDGSILLNVDEGDGASVGQFCQQGPIENIKTYTSVNVTATSTGDKGLQTSFQALSVSFKESTSVLCTVDLSKEEGLYLDIEKVRPGSNCELKMNSVTQERITVSSQRVTKMSFLDCAPTDLHITARKSIECLRFSDCLKTPVPLAVPVLPSCLPGLLSNVTWTLRAPPGGTVELLSSTGNLRQSLPGQLCDGSILLNVAESNGASVGQFCQQGPIEKIKIYTSVNVTATSTGDKGLQTSFQALSVSFKEKISETYIFHVSLKKYDTAILATPSWPAGMRSDSTVSWIVTVPPEREAHVIFDPFNQPKCGNRHSYIMVQSLVSKEHIYNHREDVEVVNKLKVDRSFYLNMSNCMPQEGEFSVITNITLDKNNNKTTAFTGLLLTCILIMVAGLVVMVIVLVVVCVVISRRRKKQMNLKVSNDTRPGHYSITKSQVNNESHVYATIDDTLVYSHLLKRETEMGVPGYVDTYRPFTGTTEPQGAPLSSDVVLSLQPPLVPNRPPSHCQSMLDNDLYQAMVQDGMKHSGDLRENTVVTTVNISANSP